jgi:hypothetical protein
VDPTELNLVLLVAAAVLLAAVAAAGLVSSAAAAAQPGNEPSHEGNGNDQAMPPPLTHGDPVADSGHDAAPLLVDVAAAQSMGAKSADAHASTTQADANHSLIGSETVERAEAPALPQASDVGDHGAAAPAAPPMVALPSAELLAAALGDGAVGQELRSKLHSVVAEVLSVDDQGQAIDAILDAALPAHSGGAHSFAAAMTGPASAMSFGGFAVDHNLMQHIVLTHPDAVTQA